MGYRSIKKRKKRKQEFFVIRSSGMSDIIIVRPLMKSLGPIYIDNDERKIVRKRENGEAGRILVTLHNAREEEKIESFEIIKELVEEMAEEVDDINEEKTIEYFQTAIPFITRNLTGVKCV